VTYSLARKRSNCRACIHNRPVESSRGRLIIVCGLPGAGKTTHAQLLEKQLRGVRFCPDEWMDGLALDLYDEARRANVEALQWKIGQELLKLGVTVIIEWGTWGRSERDTLRLGAQELGADAELHYLTAPVDILFDRVRRRGMEDPPIEREDLARWAEAFEAPTDKELALYDSPSAVDGF